MKMDAPRIDQTIKSHSHGAPKSIHNTPHVRIIIITIIITARLTRKHSKHVLIFIHRYYTVIIPNRASIVSHENHWLEPNRLSISTHHDDIGNMLDILAISIHVFPAYSTTAFDWVSCTFSSAVCMRSKFKPKQYADLFHSYP